MRILAFSMIAAVATAAWGQSVFFERTANEAFTVQADLDALRAAVANDAPITVAEFPLPDREPVELVLEPFRLVAPGAPILLATSEGEKPAEIDLESMLFLRGHAPGMPGSHVFVALSETSGAGRVELGPGQPSFTLARRGKALSVVQARAVGGVSLPCAVGSAPGGQEQHATPSPVRGMRQAQLAIEGDYELFSLFETEIDAIVYMLQVYGAVSDIMMRDLNIRMDIVFLRLWTTPDDPWGDEAYWAIIPPEIEHDVSQLLSGTRDVGAGGLAQVCAPKSWVGFALGAFVDPTYANVNNQDVIIAAHELGHNLGSLHTHDYGVDDCDLANSPTQRGSIISYCYYFSGGYANTDMRYHVVVQERIINCLANKPNFVFDCNQNGLDDAFDVATGASADLNRNGIPDECEDCNANGVLDSDDIQMGRSADLNRNGVPDECEPDCNGNGVPDDLDISSGFSLDLHGNGVPDECEADCNANGVSDYSEIQADMTLDFDRDAVLDACQDCDLDGIPDIIALDGANSIWAISGAEGVIREYHSATGVLMRSSEAGHLDDAQDILITPDARILVSSAGDARIVEFDRTGAYVGDLVDAGDGGLNQPRAMLLHDGDLLVASFGTDEVLRYDGATGAFLGVFAAAGDGGLDDPYGLAVNLNGHVLVTSDDDRVLEFDGATGAFVRALVDHDDNGGLLSQRDMVVLPDGRLLVASMLTDSILSFDAEAGDFLGRFDYGSFEHGLDGVWGLALATDGYVYATGSEQPELFHLTDPRMLMYDPANGFLIRTNVQRPDSQLVNGRGVAFMIGEGDCNRNLIPDACDISTGRSEDVNANGVPDECEDVCYADFNNDGSLDVVDFVAYQLAWQAGDQQADCNDDDTLDVTDFVCFQTQFVAGCP